MNAEQGRKRHNPYHVNHWQRVTSRRKVAWPCWPIGDGRIGSNRPRSDRLQSATVGHKVLLCNAPLLKVYSAVNSGLPMLDLVCAFVHPSICGFRFLIIFLSKKIQHLKHKKKLLIGFDQLERRFSGPYIGISLESIVMTYSPFLTLYVH